MRIFYWIYTSFFYLNCSEQALRSEIYIKRAIDKHKYWLSTSLKYIYIEEGFCNCSWESKVFQDDLSYMKESYIIYENNFRSFYFCFHFFSLYIHIRFRYINFVYEVGNMNWWDHFPHITIYMWGLLHIKFIHFFLWKKRDKSMENKFVFGV